MIELIELKNIVKKYDNLIVFDQLNLQLRSNCTTAIMGKSGRGKTTLLRLLLNLEKPDSGEILGIESKLLSAVFQEDRLIDNLTIYQNICLPHMHKHSIPSRSEVSSALAALDIDTDIDKKVNELSGGMKRRVSIIRAIMSLYDILILDEPFKGLDVKTKEITMQYVKSNTENKTVLLVTHDRTEIDFIGCKVIEI